MGDLHKARIEIKRALNTSGPNSALLKEKILDGPKTVQTSIEFCESMLEMDKNDWETLDITAKKKQLQGDIKAVNKFLNFIDTLG